MEEPITQRATSETKPLLLVPGYHPKLVKVPSVELRKKCETVDIMDMMSDIPDMITIMTDVLNSCRKFGIHTASISAPQIGYKYRFFIIESPAMELVCINPVIVKRVGECKSVEGCLSFPMDVFYSVPRAKIIKFHYIGSDGIEHSLKLRDKFAFMVQHEVDHLDGIPIDDNGLRCSRYGGRDT